MAWSKNIEKIICCGVSLENSGINNWALTKQQALNALDYFAGQNMFVLGGDVCCIKNEKPELNYDSWHCERNTSETSEDYSRRSILTARNYIENYITSINKEVYFVLVVEETEII
jgi:hypothetical protein